MYTIKVLTDGEFEKLPFKFVKEAIGCADADKGVAYIRETGIKDVDMATINHEIDELVADVSPHEEDGIRYKKFGKPFRALFGNEEQKAAQKGTVFGNLLGGGGGWGALGSLGSLALAPMTGGASLTYMPHIATMAGAAQGGVEGKNLGSALLGALKGYGAGNVVSGGAGAVKGATAGTGAIKGAMEGLSNYGVNPAIAKALGLGSPSVSPAAATGTGAAKATPSWMLPEVVGQPTAGSSFGSASVVPMPLNLNLGNLKSLSAKPTTAQQPTAPAVNTPAAAQVPNISKTTPLVAEGYTPPAAAAGASGIGKAIGTLGTPVAQTLLGTALTGASALPKNAEFEKVASLEQLRNEIATKGSSPALYTRARRALIENYEDANKELDTIYNQAGMLDSGEYRDQKIKLAAKKADAEELLAAQIDEATMNELLGLTNLDVQMAALKYGADAADIEALRNLLGSAGGSMLSSGLTNLYNSNANPSGR